MNYSKLKTKFDVVITNLYDITKEAPGDLEVPKHVIDRLRKPSQVTGDTRDMWQLVATARGVQLP